MTQFQDKANLIWEVADLLRGDYRQSDYGKVILPMTVLRRLDCVLAPNKQKVLDHLPKVEKFSDAAKDKVLNKVAGANFHNRSQFDFTKLVADPNHIAANLRNHINGYSASAPEIIEYLILMIRLNVWMIARRIFCFRWSRNFSRLIWQTWIPCRWAMCLKI